MKHNEYLFQKCTNSVELSKIFSQEIVLNVCLCFYNVKAQHFYLFVKIKNLAYNPTLLSHCIGNIFVSLESYSNL